MQLNRVLNAEEDTLVFGSQLSNYLCPGDLIYLHGNIGAGKTTLTRGILRGLGYTGVVKSPTYQLVEMYSFSQFDVYHFDLYRIQHFSELEHLGLSDYINTHTVCIIEWASQAKNELPKTTLNIELHEHNKGRQLIIKSQNERGKILIKQISQIA